MSTEKVENQIEEEVQEEVEVDVKLEEADTPTQESSSETQEDQKNDEPVEASATTEGEEAEQGGGKQGKTKFQKRIDELTKRQREAERQRDEYYNVAQKVLNENKDLRDRATKFGQLGSTEFENRITSEVESAKAAFKKAYEEGDAEKIAESQQKMMEATAQKSQVGQIKRATEQLAQEKPVELKAPPNSKALEWAGRNSWFNKDMVMTNVAYTIHDELIRSGVQADSDEYYNQLDQRIRNELPNKFQEDNSDTSREKPNVRPQNIVTPAGNNVSSKSRKVRLSPSQVAVANRLGVKLEDYAKEYVALNDS